MPPLNRKCDVERSGTIYSVAFQECNTSLGGDGAYTNDTAFVESLPAAIEAAMTAFDGDPQFSRTGTGMIYFYEPHEGDEKYIRVCIRERRVYDLP